MFPPFDPERDERKRRQLVFTRGQVPIRVLIPNIFTLVGICAGLTAIRMGIENRFDLAVAALVFAAFLDGIDGRIARVLKASSRFGAELDSLADFVNFGVAPAIIMFNWALEDLHSLGWIAVLVFAVCSALRLARFNALFDRTSLPAWKRNYFVACLLGRRNHLVAADLRPGLGMHLPSLTPLVLLYTLGIALLMVSNVPTFSGKMIGRGSRGIRAAAVRAGRAFHRHAFDLSLGHPATGYSIYLAMIPVSAYRYLTRGAQGSGDRAGAERKGDPQ